MASTTSSRVQLSAAGSSDPDMDTLNYDWWIHEEAGSTDAANIQTPGESTTVSFTEAVGAKVVHAILELTDNGTPKLTAYRRIVIRLP